MDRETCEKLYRTYYMKVFSYLVSLSGDTHLSEDITQEVFLRAFTSEKAFRGESDVSTWLCAIGKNLFTDEMRKRKKKAEMPEGDTDSGVDIEKTVADRDSSVKIHIILHSLPEPYREVFSLRVFGELSFAQIGNIFKKTESWARVTYHRARLKISERMKEDE